MKEIEKIEKWYSGFSDKLENAFPTLDGYVAHNNILWLIKTVKEKEYWKGLFYKEYEAKKQAINDLTVIRRKDLSEMKKELLGYKKALEDIVEHSELSYQGEVAKKSLDSKRNCNR